ncbi:DNA alkylation repair protein [Hoeflea olei]|uniref:DNA alkylation repair protein n=1 Tax=Hoeflea olei TaxID=1480615 RepID=A0A1C1YR30_9HYPH|nr:DNA alkylation repair protein [Hoeflea olei]OCW55992.1 DNA alkylation repair protein [Hoeflea olei]
MSGTKTPGRGVRDIAPDRLACLNAGTVEAATLTECLAVDFAALLRNVLPEIGADALAEMDRAAATGISRRMALAARLIRDALGDAAADRLQRHPSDTARGWACFLIGMASDMSLADRLVAMRPYADDRHFGVREWSWMAVRPHLAADLDRAIALLSAWTADPSERIRRFASEAIRPRGVWCAHIGVLRNEPHLGLAVLEPLRADPSLYVQDSVGNWLNDAAKDRPEWVQALCARWTLESPVPATARICKRALRSIKPAPHS